jgi:DNA ligase-1
MLFATLVATADAVGATSKRTAKVAALVDLLRRLETSEVEAAVGFLVGRPRQGRVGVGWSAVRGVPAASATEPSLTIADVDEAISRVEGITGAGSVAQRQAALGALFSAATEPEGQFLARLLLGELRQGALEGVMAEGVAKAAAVPVELVRRAAMFSGDLGRTAVVALSGGAVALEGIGLEVLRPVQPMLAGTAPDVTAALAETGQASVEWKLDGARIQVHRDDDEVKIFTRNLNDITGRLPSVAEAVRRLPVRRVVLDGESIGLDDSGRPRRFQDTMSRFSRERLSEDAPAAALQAFFFDVLLVDDEDLVDRPLVDRLDVLETIAPALRLPALTTADPAAAEAFALDAVAAGHEGVMVKSLESTYQAGRRGGSWRKVKPVRTLDLVVLAAEWGHGRRTGWLSNLHLGARGADGGFVMVGKTFKGLTDDLLRWQTQRLQELAIGTEGHVVHVRPELVVEIALDGVQASTRYPGGVALRFARVRRYREDKRATEADRIEDVQALLA